MPKSYEVQGTRYDFPDSYSDDQVQGILSKQGVIGPHNGYLSQVGHGLWNTVKGLAQVGSEAGAAAVDPLNAVEHLKNLKKMVLDPQVDQAFKAVDEWKKGNHSESVGHALASVIPGVGPAAANIGEKLGNQDYRGAAADATTLGLTMAAPHVIPKVMDSAPLAAARGAVSGGAKTFTNTVNYGRIHIPVPEPIAGAASGAFAGEVIGRPFGIGEPMGAAGGLVGGAIPIIRGAVKGARESLAEHAATHSPPLVANPAWRTIPDAPVPTANEPIPTAPPVLPSGRAVPPAGYVPPRSTAAPAPSAAAEGVTAIDILKGMYPKRTRFTPDEMAQGRALAEKVNAQSATQPAAPTAPPESTSPPLLPETQPEPPNPALTSTEPTNAPTPPAQKPWSEMTKPEMFEALGLPRDATTQQFVERFAEETKKSGTAPQVPAEAQANPNLDVGLAEAARQIPQGMRKEVAKANYRAVKEGSAEQETASPTYEAMNRAVKVEPVVKALMDNGITYSDMTKLTKPEIESYVNQLSSATAAEGGSHPGNVFSGLSIDELLGELRRAENAAKGAQK